MISVMNDCEIERKSGFAADLHLFGIETVEKSAASDNRMLEGVVGPEKGKLRLEKCQTECSSSKMETGGVRASSVRDMEAITPENEGEVPNQTVIATELDVRGDFMKPEGTISELKDVDICYSHENFETGLIIEDADTNHESRNVALRIYRMETDMETAATCSYRSSSMFSGSPTGSNFWTHGFEPGDMVWGKVKSHPWWPGHILSEAFASNSVRRIKRAGHVLVAFFGDSSYGWFDPAELVPFEPHYAEKSHQTNSRNFLKAVEEAMDEACRRQALGLVCRCRKPFNFRPTDVNGYVVVDLDDYEPGGIYSGEQIKKARDSFCPSETLMFVQDLALCPRNSEQRSIDWMQNMAKLRAYRKAVFEEFDETYAQAFGMEPVRPPRNSLGVLEQPDKVPPRAPLSGPLVIAEALNEKKNSLKPAKVKDALKKDKYLFKRRDVRNGQGVVQANVDYVLQKRTPIDHESNVLVKVPTVQEIQTVGNDLIATNVNSSDMLNTSQVNIPAVRVGRLQANQALPYAGDPVLQESVMDGNLKLETTDPVKVGMKSTSSIVGPSESSGTADSVAEPKEGDGTKVSETSGNVQVLTKTALKRPLEKFPSESASLGERKKKKKKKSQGFEVDMDHRQKQPKMVDEESLKKRAGKSIGIGLDNGAHFQMDFLRKEDEVVGTSSSASPLLPQLVLDMGNLDFPQLVEDLLALALDPFHGVECNSPTVVRGVFLKFRSLIYQKSLVLQPASEYETSEKVQQESAVGNAEEQESSSASKLLKHPPRPDDPTKMGRKRGPSDRQEEMSAKRLKKLNKLKALASEKKASALKVMDGQKGERKEMTTPTTVKPVKDLIRKQDPAPVRPADPISLVLKFPPRTMLPSVPQLKARFARFGPLDLSGMRIFWKSSTCRVVFKHKSDAQAAFNYATRNNTLFGHKKVTYNLKEYEVPGQASAAEPPEAGKQRIEDSGSDDFSVEARPMGYQERGPAVQLKSCLKKPTGDDTTPSMAKESPRVKFLLGGEDSSSREEPTVVGGGEDRIASTSSLDNISSSKSTKTSAANPPRMQPETTTISLSENRGTFQYSKAHVIKDAGNKEDFSYQMLSLMVRCSDIVSNVKHSLGYAPYHPL
ncbi:PWWP domain-containing protein 1-like [Aristolochia californica]|uniref:PWWP domain-containing protein 1-like n=1 Tax=Aristolochia californica TaxID=171875 RepID=UPI0035D9F651